MTERRQNAWAGPVDRWGAWLVAWLAIGFGLYAIPMISLDGGGLMGVIAEFVEKAQSKSALGMLRCLWILFHVAAAVTLALSGLMIFRRHSRAWVTVRVVSLVVLITTGVYVVLQVERRSLNWSSAGGYDGPRMAMEIANHGPVLLVPLLLCIVAYYLSDPIDKSSRGGFEPLMSSRPPTQQ